MIQNRTQEIVSDLKTVEGALMTAPAILFSLFAGAYSDRHGRKLLLAAPFLGNIISFLSMFINLFWWSELPAQFLLFSGLAGLSGGYVCFNIGVYSYTADVSSRERRTMRMSLLNGIFSLGFVIGIQVGSRVSSYLIIFLVSTMLGCLGLLYTLIIIKEVPRTVNTKSEQSAFGLSPVKESFRTAFGRREEGRRAQLIILLLAFLSLMLCLNTGDFDYLMTRIKFGWSSEDWGNYLTAQRVTRLISLIIILPVLSSVLGVGDNIIVICGLIITCISYIIMCFTSSDWMMYLAALTQMNSITTVSIRSQLSKIVEATEIGKIFAVVGIGQSLVSLISHSLFGAVYRSTLSIFPSMYLIIVILCIALAALGVITVQLMTLSRSHQVIL